MFETRYMAAATNVKGDSSNMPFVPPANFPKLRSEFIPWLGRWEWNRFVTLATNSPQISTYRAKDLLKEWDARMNRHAVGNKWQKRPDEALWAFYFFEKAEVNPHWHCLFRFMKFTEELEKRQARAIDEEAENVWKTLLPCGTVDVQIVFDQKKIAQYVSKSVGHHVPYEAFVVPDEFRKPLW